MKNPQQLLSGEHTRSISNPTPTTGGLMRFVKVPINDGALCKNCSENEVQLYWKQLDNVNRVENPLQAHNRVHFQNYMDVRSSTCLQRTRSDER